MTNTSFDPLKPGEGWQDQGLVLMSKDGDDFNAIDPFRIDVSDGRAYLAFGSFWSGIKLSELDPATGKLIRAGCAPHRARQPQRRVDRSRLDPRARRQVLPLRQLRPVLQGRRLDLQHPRRARRPDRGSHTATRTARRCWRAAARW